MRIIVEGPKFSGKSTLSNKLKSIFPGCTYIEVRCFFDRPYVIENSTHYYKHRRDTLKTLRLLIDAFSSCPKAEDIIIKRFHFFDWVSRMTSLKGREVDWSEYRRIEDILIKEKYKIICLLPSLELLNERLDNCDSQEVRIPRGILKFHMEYYMEAVSLTKIPTLIVEKFDIQKIISWIEE